MTDRELIHGLQRRDPIALAALVDAYGDPVYRLVRRILAGAGNEPDVEECASDVFYAAWQRVAQYDPERAPLRTWLLILAKYTALERRRGLLKHPDPMVDEELLSLEAPPEVALVKAEERQELQGALAQLAPIDRELVYRRYFLHERVEQVARALGLTRQAADNRLWRARKVLREILSSSMKGEVVPHE